jgi:DNA-directed RNA polymerase specialized sigma54-like protein
MRYLCVIKSPLEKGVGRPHPSGTNGGWLLLNPSEADMQINDNSKQLTDGQIKTLIDRYRLLMATDHTVTNICRQKRVSRDTYYRHIDNYFTQGLSGLLDSHNQPAKETLISMIRGIARSNPELGCRKISELLKRDGINISYKTVNNYLREECLSKVSERIKYRADCEAEMEMYQ